MVTTTRIRGERLRQGDVVANIEWVRSFCFAGGDIIVSTITFPRAVVLSQDCDLVNHSSQLMSVLLVPLYVKEHFVVAEHLSEISVEGPGKDVFKSKTYLKAMENNEVQRFHYLELHPSSTVPDSMIDFLQYFTVSYDVASQAWKLGYICSVCSPFRESITQRFTSYISRTAVPLYCRASCMN